MVGIFMNCTVIFALLLPSANTALVEKLQLTALPDMAGLENGSTEVIEPFDPVLTIVI